MRRQIFLTLVLLATWSYSFTQKITELQPTYYLDTATGKLYWNKGLPAFLFISPTSNIKDGIQLESHKTKQYADPFYFDTEGINYIRTRWAVNKETQQPVNVEIIWEVYADGTPPSTKAILLDPNKAIINDTIYCSKELKIILVPRDNLSGVKYTLYSLNNDEFVKYADTIILNKEQSWILKYLSVDNVHNVEKVRQIEFITDYTPPTTEAIIAGVYLGKRNIVSTTTNIFLEAKDDISGVKTTYYRIDSSKWIKYIPKTRIPLNYLEDGNHILEFYSVDMVNNKETIQKFEFYLDKTAPIIIADVLGDKFVVNNQVYFSGRTKLKLTAVDNKAGVKKILYSVDNSEFKEYTDPFYLPSVPGWHIVKFFAIDSTENISLDKLTRSYYEYRMKVDKIYVDLNGPDIYYTISGPKYIRNDTIFVSDETNFILSANDPESGLQYISYRIDDEKKEKIYDKPFTLEHYKEGLHKIEVAAYDNVNNRNSINFEVFLDKEPPYILYNFDIKPIGYQDSLPVYTRRTKLFLSFVDDYTGTTKILYSLNNSPPRFYQNYITNFQKGINVVNIEVWDKVGNRAVKTIRFYVK